jgi:four helix bundle protein
VPSAAFPVQGGEPGSEGKAEMSKGIGRFEDLIAWQRARSLAGEVYELTATPPFAADPDMKRQMRRAATSVMSNIAEGFERFSKKGFSHFLRVAKASCAEVRSLLYLACDVGYVGVTAFDRVMSQACECGRVIGGLRAAIRRSPALSD